MFAQEDFAVQQYAAIEIQRVWRGSVSRVDICLMLEASCIMQASARRMIAQKKFLRLKVAVRTVQSFYRSWKMTVAAEEAHSAAIVLQSHTRRYIARKEFTLMKAQVIVVQAFARRILGILEAERLRSVILIQSFHRSKAAQQKYESLRRGMMTLQACIRGTLARRSLSVEQYAAVGIQRVWRGMFANCNFMLKVLSSINIQAGYRRYAARRRYLKMQSAAVLLQYKVRKILMKKKLSSVITIQRIWRGFSQSCIYTDSLWASLVIQATYRRYRQYRLFQYQKVAATKIQCAVRAMIARNKAKAIKIASINIQRAWRGYEKRIKFLIQLLAIIEIQSLVRSFFARKQMKCHRAAISIQCLVRMKRAKDVVVTLLTKSLEYRVVNRLRNSSVSKIQTAFRKYRYKKCVIKSTNCIQRFFRKAIGRCYMMKKKSAIVEIQSLFRGFCVRRRRTKQVILIARKVKKANRKAFANPEMKLGARTSAALDVILTSRSLSEIMQATATLEVSTRLSTICCRNFAAAGAPSKLYAFIQTCNRSLPHVELLQLVLVTISNVARHNDCLYSIATHDAVGVLLNLMQHFRDKEVIFHLAVNLLNKICRSGVRFKVSL